ncbi:MAG: hypothetical protein D4R73_09415 [Deltaproteobacteria bacterium]|nr:MAG: hypothetical protein D4R73_09415 [Deltaproteobacteria bacterium]
MSRETQLIHGFLSSDAYIQSNASLRWALGRDEADLYAELLSRNNYFENRGELTVDGYFFNTVISLYVKTSINGKHQRTAIANLRKHGLIDFVLRGAPPKRYFKMIATLKIIADLIMIGKEKAQKASDDAKCAEMEYLNVPKWHSNKNNLNKNKARIVPNNKNGGKIKEVYDNYRPM